MRSTQARPSSSKSETTILKGVLASVAVLLFNRAQAADSAGPADTSGSELAEVVVTAEKRAERLQDVPVPVTAINTDSLLENNLVRLEDYYTSVPGLSLTSSTFGQPSVIIRGIATGAGTLTNPTVGIVVDDVPYGSSTPLGGGAIVPDIDPSDLARVEVLRGPQGTFYGASSIGGLIKFVTVDPSTEALTGRLQADGNDVHNGPDAGYGLRGSINIPLSDTWAMRASGFFRHDPGYITDVLTDVRGVNREEDYGGRLSALWKPSEDLSLKLGALFQDSRRYGLSGIDTGSDPEDLSQTAIPNTGGFERKYEVYSANLNVKLGGATLTSISGYSINSMRDSVDLTSGLSALTQSVFGDGIAGLNGAEFNKTTKFSEELRLAMSFDERFDWLLGGFYTHEYSPYQQPMLAANAATGEVVGTALLYSWWTKYEEYALFTDLTVHFTDRFDVQFGGRESASRQSSNETDSGPFVPIFEGLPSPVQYGLERMSENAFTYLVTPRLKLSPDLMLYARLASGYRPGGPEDVASQFRLPLTYAPDKTQNYELGIKGETLDRTVSFDASVYYIDWKHIQVTVVDPTVNVAYFTNGSQAKSQGVELSGQWAPLTGLKMGAWVAFNDAKLTEAFPDNSAAYGVAGDRLPYSSRWSGNVSVDDDFPLNGPLTGFVGAVASYVGSREGEFKSSPPDVTPRNEMPSYTMVNLHGGVKYEAWTANLYVNNVSDSRGILNNDHTPYVYLVQPRTIGLSFVRTF
jgi:iron complex outermembrane recepter protein